MFHQPVLIYNPAAGKLRRNPEGILQRTKAALARGRVGTEKPLELLPTTGPDMAGNLAREAIGRGADLVIVLGGDGTVNEVLQGMAQSSVPLGVLPGGTANCLAMELGLGSRLERAVERLTACQPKTVALGRATPAGVTANGNGSASPSRWFLLMCGAGLDAAIVDEVHSGLKKSTGKLAYWVAGLAQFRRRVGPMKVEVGGKTFDCGFALFSSIRNYGGDMEIASGASLLKDDFEIVLFEGTNPLRYAAYMMAVGIGQVQKMPGVHTLRAQSAQLITPAPTQVDGEFFSRGAVRLEAVPNAITLLLPAGYK
ncbi:MAG: diacylglycerol kinase family protein [Acidobacteriota bacterium]